MDLDSPEKKKARNSVLSSFWSPYWGEVYFLYNRPFYSVEILENKRIGPKVTKVFKSYYELCHIDTIDLLGVMRL